MSALHWRKDIEHLKNSMAAVPNIVILSGVQGDTRRYRAFHLHEQLQLAGVPCRMGHISDRQAGAIASRADILILQRVTWDRNVDTLIQKAELRRAVIVTDLDDYVFDPEAFRWIDSPDFKDPIRAGLYRENMRRNRETVMRSDGVLASTHFLFEKIEKIGKPVRLHKNAFSLEMYAHSLQALQDKPLNNRTLIIGYASGTPTHNSDFALVRPVLQRLLKAYPEPHFSFAGYLDHGAGWGSNADRVHRLPFVPWRKLPSILAGFAINLAPLRLDNPFSQSKSEIKYMEAALVKTVTVASPTDAFQSAIQPGYNGLLAGNEPEWEEALRNLIESPDLRQSTGEQAYEQVLQAYSPWQRSCDIVETLNDLLDLLGSPHARMSVKPVDPIQDPNAARQFWVTPGVEKHPTLVERGIYSLKVRGVTTLMKEIWIFIRRLAAPLFPFK